MKLHLPDVTLLCIDTYNFPRAETALYSSVRDIEFGACKFLCSIPAAKKRFEIGQLIGIPNITSKEQYSEFCLFSLDQYIETPFVLIVQWDGYIVNSKVWTDEFLNFDYIGAIWEFHSFGNRVGNGGFSLRSKKLLQTLLAVKNQIVIYHPEDSCICRENYKLLTQQGIKYAPEHIAKRFSIENAPYSGQFGFHGRRYPI